MGAGGKGTVQIGPSARHVLAPGAPEAPSAPSCVPDKQVAGLGCLFLNNIYYFLTMEEQKSKQHQEGAAGGGWGGTGLS